MEKLGEVIGYLTKPITAKPRVSISTLRGMQRERVTSAFAMDYGHYLCAGGLHLLWTEQLLSSIPVTHNDLLCHAVSISLAVDSRRLRLLCGGGNVLWQSVL